MTEEAMEDGVPTGGERWIVHADMDAFYASVEQRDNPELRGKPVIVGATSARGVVSAASYEARQFGVRSAMPGFRARELCPQGVFLGGDMKKYARVSAQIHQVLAEFSDMIEPLALDEAFVDVTGSVSLLGSPVEIGESIKRRVREETELAISVGIASNKLVAKIATDLGKPDGLVLVPWGGERALLAPLPVRRLFGVGPKAEERLAEAGISTIGELARASDDLLIQILGRNFAELRERASGIDLRPVEAHRAPKSIGEESTFPDDVRERDRITAALSAHSEVVASRARRSGWIGDTVVLKVKLSRRRSSAQSQVSSHELFPLLSRQAKLPRPTADAAELRRVAVLLWDKLALTEPIRLIGVTLTGLQSAGAPRQLDLFDQPPAPGSVERTALGEESPLATATSRGERLGHALDAIGEKFGPGAIRVAASAPDKVTHSDRHKLGDED